MQGPDACRICGTDDHRSAWDYSVAFDCFFHVECAETEGVASAEHPILAYVLEQEYGVSWW